jgi:hypothetical protein
MSAAASAAPSAPGRILAAALVGGLIAGTLDILLASLIYKASLVVILQAIARGWLGKAAFQGGLSAAALGLGSQWFISVVAALIYGLAGRAWPFLLKRPLLCGPVFGAGVFLVMREVVSPLSAVQSSKLPAQPMLTLDFLANLLFGLIIAFVASRMLRPGRR